jgi:hypothetical protein
VASGRRCVDVAADVDNCGQVGHQCNDDEYCVSGACVCRPGLTNVGGNCVDTNTDPNHCGPADATCGGGTPRCAGGVCVASCGGGFDNCNGACVDTDTDPLNCGGCGDNCNNDEICVNGNCHQFRPAVGCNTCPCAVTCVGDFQQCCTYPNTTKAVCVDANSCP